MVFSSTAGAGDWGRFFLRGLPGDSAVGSPAAPATQSARQPDIQIFYDHDFGRLVLGGRVALEGEHRAARSDHPDDLGELRLRAGYDLGPSLGYLSFGREQREIDGMSARETVIGLGLTYSLNQALRLSGEYLRDTGRTGSSGGAGSEDRFSIRAAFEF
ncbi:porin family protein [Phaeobacter sp.]|uniref:outer membrane protein n=1 Tax=Phaeobacter sp. TaxID=1902409 RepID=UPI0025D0BD78|nr:porin family protein [Phaeobacter sp.]